MPSVAVCLGGWIVTHKKQNHRKKTNQKKITKSTNSDFELKVLHVLLF